MSSTDSFDPNRILFEDNHLFVINKQPGELVQSDITGDLPVSEKIKAYLKIRESKPGNVYLGFPHRIDRPVSGILIFAKTSKAMSRLAEMFRKRAVQKTYWAVVENRPLEPAGSLTHWMIKNQNQNKSYVSDVEKPGYRLAKLQYRHVCSSDNYHLLEVNLETGRHHQIRAQLAHIGCVVKGDVKYGAKRSNPDLSIHLHSRRCVITHPVTKNELELVAPVPDDPLWQWFESKLG
ncbi:MAG: RNA pseudouridine synthase [Salibacteraceae bacterium]